MVQASGRAKQKRGAACCSNLSQLLSPRMFKALGDPRRVALLVRLAEARGPCTVGDVAQGSDVDLSVVSRHLAILREAGVIRCVKRGKEVWCTVEAGVLARMLRDLADAFETCCPSKPTQDTPSIETALRAHRDPLHRT